MDTLLGLIFLVGFIIAVMVLAAAVTWVVVKLSPSRARDESATPG